MPKRKTDPLDGVSVSFEATLSSTTPMDFPPLRHSTAFLPLKGRSSFESRKEFEYQWQRFEEMVRDECETFLDMVFVAVGGVESVTVASVPTKGDH